MDSQHTAHWMDDASFEVDARCPDCSESGRWWIPLGFVALVVLLLVMRAYAQPHHVNFVPSVNMRTFGPDVPEEHAFDNEPYNKLI